MTAAVPDRKRLEYALLLIARQHGCGPDKAQAARDALARWRALDPANEQAAQHALAGWAATDGRALQGALPLPGDWAQVAQQTRRRALSVLGIAGMAGVVGALGRWHWLQPLERMALHTGHGQQLTRLAADGSRFDLAPHSEALVLLYRQRRDVQLVQGEIRLDVAPDADRPLEVLTPLGRVRVLGTAFSVALHGGSMQVRVSHGRVAVWRHGADVLAAPDAVLKAGEALRMDASGQAEAFSVNAHDVGAWREGWLVFDRTPLVEVVARWNDYLARPLVLEEGDALQSLRLTGSFKLREPATFLASLPRSLPVRVVPLSDGRMRIQRR